MEAVWTPIRYALITIGFVGLLKEKKYFLATMLFSFILYFAAITGPEGGSRLRLMFEPVLIIMTALGISKLLSYKSRKNM